jgi:hypothetical protein
MITFIGLRLLVHALQDNNHRQAFKKGMLTMNNYCNSCRLFYSGLDLNDVLFGTLLKELKMYGDEQR